MKKHCCVFAASLICIALLLTACNGSGTSGDANALTSGGALGGKTTTLPVIQSLYVTGAPAAPGGMITATVDAQSPQNLALTYSWSVSGTQWSISSGQTTSVVSINAPPAYSAAGIATVTVTDSNGNAAIGRISFSTVSDTASVIESIAIYPQPVMTSANLVGSTFDQDGDILTYSWTVGGISNLLTGKTAIWNSPGIPGYYTVELFVSDGTTTVSGVSSMSIDSPSPWPRFHRDLQSTGQSPVYTNTTGTLKWSYPTGGLVLSSPAIGADGTVYVGSYDGNLYAINRDGTLKWSYQTGDTVRSSPAIGSDGTVYVGSVDKNLYAIKPDGTLKWSYLTGSYVYSSPAIGADGTVYVGSFDYNLYAINSDGTLKWTYPIGDNVDSSPAIGADGTVYVGSHGSDLFAIKPDGTLKWSCPAGGVNSAPAIAADGTVYLGSNDGNVYAINPDGTFKWSYATGAYVFSSPAIGADGTVYVGSFDKNLYAIKPDGTLKWSYHTGDSVNSSPAIGADGTVYVASWDGNFYAINANGTLKWKYLTGSFESSSPAIGADGAVYVGSYNKNIYAIE